MPKIEPNVILCQGIAYLAGIRWQLASDKKKVRRVIKDATAYYVLEHHLGIRYAVVPSDKSRAYSLAIVFSRVPGVLPDAIVAWHIGDQYGCIGLKDQLPVPGFDIVCSRDALLSYIRLFSGLMHNRAAIYTNHTDIFDELSSRITGLLLIDLSGSLDRPPGAALPTVRSWRPYMRILGLASLLLVLACYLHKHIHSDAIINTTMESHVVLSHPAVALSERGDMLLSWIQEHVFSFPVYIGGWRLDRIHCHHTRCLVYYDQQFSDVSNFSSFYHYPYPYTYHLSDRQIQVVVNSDTVMPIRSKMMLPWHQFEANFSHFVNAWLYLGIHFYSTEPHHQGPNEVAHYTISGMGIFFPYIHLLSMMSMDELSFVHGVKSDHFEIKGQVYAHPDT